MNHPCTLSTCKHSSAVISHYAKRRRGRWGRRRGGGGEEGSSEMRPALAGCVAAVFLS